MIPFLLDPSAAIPIELAAGGAGAYGAPQRRELPPGAYVVISDTVAVVRDSPAAELRLGAGGNKLEIPVEPLNPLPMLIRSGSVTVAARDAAGVCWFIPLVDLRALERPKC